MMNKFERTCAEIVETFKLGDEEWASDIFPNLNIETVRNLVKEKEDTFRPKIQWLIDVIDKHSTNAKRDKEFIRSEFKDNPKKVANRLFDKPSPENPLPVESFVNHYGASFSQEPPDYTPLPNDELTIPERVATDDFDERFKKEVLMKEYIDEVLRSKNHTSATGKDSISNAIFKIANSRGVKLVQIVMQSIISTKHIPESWKSSKTILLSKKLPADSPANWRPIGITSCFYRIIMSCFSSFLMRENRRKRIFHRCQKGFIKDGGGPSDFIATLNELIYHAKRTSQQIVLTTIDLSNAFGSVPHQMIFEALDAKGFTGTFKDIIQDLYMNTSTQFDVNGHRSAHVAWKRGVIQGCPLSPLLFNCALDGLLYTLERRSLVCGIEVQLNNDDPQYIFAQAYADDVVLIAKSKDKMEQLINNTFAFCTQHGLTVAIEKCHSIGIVNQDIERILKFGRNHQKQIPIKDIHDSLTYLGAPISGSRIARIKSCQTTLDAVKARIAIAFGTKLSISQKLEMLRTYILPILDYHMVNGQFSLTELEKLDEYINGRVIEELHAPNLPKEFRYLPAKYGGLGIPNLVDKYYLSQLTQLIRMWVSSSPEIRTLARMSLAEETANRGVHIITNNDEAWFFCWKVEYGEIAESHPERKMNSMIERAFKACKHLGIRIREFNDEIQIQSNDIQFKSIRNASQARDLINDILAEKWLKTLQSPERIARGHSTTGNLDSSSNPHKGGKYINDNLFRFLVKARANILKTPANCKAWGLREEGNCPFHDNKPGTLYHILNGCRPNKFQEYTWRHNLAIEILRREITNKFHPDYYRENCSIDIDTMKIIDEEEIDNGEIEQLPDELKLLKPDIIFIDQNTEIAHIVEFTAPYNTMFETTVNGESITRNTLEMRIEQKNLKYQELVATTARISGREVELHTIVVSSLGHVPTDTVRELSCLLGKKIARKVAERISKAMIEASAVIFHHQHPRNFGSSHTAPFIEEEESTSNEDEDAPGNAEEAAEQSVIDNHPQEREDADAQPAPEAEDTAEDTAEATAPAPEPDNTENSSAAEEDAEQNETHESTHNELTEEGETHDSIASEVSSQNSITEEGGTQSGHNTDDSTQADSIEEDSGSQHEIDETDFLA